MKLKDKYLTIAVPVYNVEKYLRRCLDSLVNQEIENFEILLVDDGSSDSSGAICDEYAKKYSFVRVIHQENKGLAAVRNICVKEARGKYISFIDSDDYLLPGTYEHLLRILKEEGADILCFGHIDVYEDSGKFIELKEKNGEEQILTLTAEEAIDEMLLPAHIDVITCNKIIKLSLYEGIEYPVGKLYEDMFTNYKVIAKAKKIVSTNYKFYVYCHRPSSIGGMKFNEKTMDLARAAKEVYDFANDFCKNKKNIDVGLLHWLIVVANIMIKAEAVDNKYIIQVQNFARKNTMNILKNKYIHLIRKFQYVLFGLSINLYKKVYLGYIDINR